MEITVQASLLDPLRECIPRLKFARLIFELGSMSCASPSSGRIRRFRRTKLNNKLPSSTIIQQINGLAALQLCNRAHPSGSCAQSCPHTIYILNLAPFGRRLATLSTAAFLYEKLLCFFSPILLLIFRRYLNI